ncbi:MAG: AAA family ATPase [Bacilli bacterium]|nr:AAA family ATPase [Bacilli bacterium]
MKKIPYGESDFKKIILEDYYYVDKTMYLEKLEEVSSKVVYLRPRRFGKTLFTSMMGYYYDINSNNLYDELFKDTYVYNHPTKNKNNYYILNFDFSGMSFHPNNEEEISISFLDKIISGLRRFSNQYKIDYEIKPNLSPERLISDFLDYFESLNLDHKIYLIIDEYDNFTNSILSNNVNMFQHILGQDGFVKAFYARIKEYCKNIIDRVFITGVCSISLDSMTSGFNISENITNNSMFNSMTALTHEEVKELLKEIPDSEKHYNTMIENYDGYKFNKDGDFLFNPTLTMYYLKSVINTGKEPLEFMDPNIISSYEQIKNIVSLGDYKKIMNDIFDNGEIDSSLKVNFNLNSEFSQSDIISLLYYFGYLTIKDYYISGYRFVIPNRVLKTIYGDYYLSILRDSLIRTYDDKEFALVNEIMEDGKLDKLCEYISFLLKNMDNRIYIDYKEKDLQIMFYTILIRYLLLDVYLEYPSGDNFIDLAIFTKKYNYLVELKYIKEKDKKSYDEVYKKAKEQIEKYTIHKDNLGKYIIIFTGSNYTLEKV